MFKDADKEGMVSHTNSEVAGMTETLLSFLGSENADVPCSKTSYLQQRHKAVNTFNVWEFRISDVLQQS